MKSDSKISLPGVVAAILVMGILAVLSHRQLPDPEAQRRSMAMSGLAGSLRSGAALAHSIWLANGTDSTVVEVGGWQSIEINPLTGYPSANGRGIRSVVRSISGFSGIDQGATYVFSIAGASIAACNVTYATGDLAGEPPTVTVKNNSNGGDCG